MGGLAVTNLKQPGVLLLSAKEASARPQDRIDIDKLKEADKWIHLTINSAPLHFAPFIASDPSRYAYLLSYSAGEKRKWKKKITEIKR